MWNWIHRLGSPPIFYRLAERALPYCAWICAALLAAGAWQALLTAPPDYKQGTDTGLCSFMSPPRGCP